ncbi:trifunctional transcriptional regulator/proline dehydrogenase/L-glutamate gamma-semialdehyde dehydrogenase [Rhodovarius lipocyclicus]|uniref:trifunctional transcriptional regulator/proline dehydrogenase/L-glutamate gamma-semialdehyde dehydrogenase n=1 Tax=Rhodovarius lipocyclicus TaxID=268410 RepID=UPI001359CF67|nr:trifunctional transcriptional regulator/proline dehydrogenase/L-glutamate gamma-semialdehyde dehydrogenase [Rhodovarius lipocyclicus]
MPPFDAFAEALPPQSPSRARITAACRPPEPECLPPLIAAATLPAETSAQATALATRLVTALRAKGTRGPVEGLVHEYSLSSQEGVALMCLAEALLRIPDAATRDALIRDKIAPGDWRRHVGHSPSLFVNAATWGLVITGKLTATTAEAGLAQALTRLVAKGGEPLIRQGVAMAMRMMGEQFVTGQTIMEALTRARRLEARGFRYSYDMLGEAATTAADAARYCADYEAAIHAIGQAAAGLGPYEGPGISIKLSALHPRYSRAQRGRVMTELLPRLRALAGLARRYDIGLNIDAEEADRLELSLDLLEALCLDPALAGWKGIGFVVQAYQKRAPFVLDWVIELARRSGHRLMVRLVKGAYWDAEIKRAQVDGLADFPVFTRKAHTDVSYIACARKLLAAPDAVFPQFATHNARTLATIHALAGEGFHPGQYEFQCLHGMGEPLYEEVVGPDKLGRPCRIYAPVGTHETLLAYLVRRLLENGANSSFVNRIQDPAVPVAELAADPVPLVAAGGGAPHPRIALPRETVAHGGARGLDLASEATLAALAPALRAAQDWRAGTDGPWQPVRNPADHRDIVGQVAHAAPAAIEAALAGAEAAFPAWSATPPAERAACLDRAAALLEARMPALLGLIVREAGKSLPNAVSEVREAVDFLRYYASQARGFGAGHVPLGPIACISPWNFPLAIFLGQVSAALAAGNTVLAKPAEETPLTAAAALAILHEAGVPLAALHLLPGLGEVGARLVADARVCGVVFTGSTAVARLIQRELARRLNPDGRPVPLIAETGGQNALVVDSSALAEQVVGDVLASAFDSAGQRCSALRVLCLQEDVADRILAMLKGALAELAVGNPEHLATDIGPVITPGARDAILAHIGRLRAAGLPVHQPPLPEACAQGSFVPPTIIELDDLSRLTAEVFGPVLHVVRWRREGLDALLRAIDATGYALTFGVHSRIEETIQRALGLSAAGNAYVNRNLIGAVVGVQPFGGHGLSGTGPKAGGPLYLRRLLAARPLDAGLPGQASHTPWRDWLAAHHPQALPGFEAMLAATPLGVALDLPGPVGERNQYRTTPRGDVLCLGPDAAAAIAQIGAALATGNRPVVPAGLDVELPGWIARGEAGAAILSAAGPGALIALNQRLAALEGPILPLLVPGADGAYPLDPLVLERSISTNTAAAGGNASLMSLEG